ncbi:MAG: glucose-6-phosphate dehydrogenase [Patescibacteria group bacterium]
MPQMKKIHEPLTIFLIGVTGDLSKKKILKAIFKLFEKDLLSAPFTLVGNARQPMSRAEFQAFVKGVVKPEKAAVWEKFSESLYYVAGDASQAKTFDDIKAMHHQLTSESHCGNHMWYVATLPKLYLSIVKNLKQFRLHSTDCGWTKFMIEKPFGTDLATAQELNQELSSIFTEDQIFRIDHTLGKETVQNLLAFRFANGLFEHLWNNKYIDHIQLVYAETLGIGGREQFYDETGALRDVVQNHILQIIAMTMMEEPASLDAKDIRHSRSELLKNLSCVKKAGIAQNVHFGQYSAGEIYGDKVKSYRDEHASLHDSETESAVALRLQVDNDRWRDVPIYVRTGKRFAQDVLEIAIQFKDPKNSMFKDVPLGPEPNVLSFRFQPNEGIILKLFVKKPGHGIVLDQVPMSFCYHSLYQMGFIEAYERLIHDASLGDPTLFPEAEAIEATWKIIDELLEYKKQIKPELYPAGSWGPKSFDELIERDGRKWIEPDMNACKL